jgi:hypothetical protein
MMIQKVTEPFAISFLGLGSATDQLTGQSGRQDDQAGFESEASAAARRSAKKKAVREERPEV